MKKAHYRDYATEAFRFWARKGPAEKYRQSLWNEALERHERLERSTGISAPSEAAIMRAEQAVKDAEAELKDMDAVEFALEALEKLRGRAAIKAIQMVYLKDPNRDIQKGEIEDRVHEAEISIPASERTIYRYLSLARRLFAEKRGLRM